MWKHLKIVLTFFFTLSIHFCGDFFTKELIFQRNLSNLKIKGKSLLIGACGFKKVCSIHKNILTISYNQSTKKIKIPSKKPHHFIYHEHFLYISDTLLNNILKFDLDNQQFEWFFTDEKPLNFPKELAINNNNGNLFIADYANQKISTYNQDKKEIKFFLYRDKASNELAAPLSISIFQNFLYALYPAEQKLIKFHLKTTEILSEYDLKSSKPKLFSKASQINIDLYGFLYIFDRKTKTISIFNQSFELQDKLLNSSYFYPKLSNAKSFNIDTFGNLYIQSKNSVYCMKVKNEELLLQNLKHHYKNSNLKVIISQAKNLLKKYPQNKTARKYLLEALELKIAGYIHNENWDMASIILKESLKISPSDKSSLRKLRIISFKKNRVWIMDIFFGVSLLMIFLLASYTLLQYLFSKPKEPKDE
ncbi:MAG: hypothetical protein COB02_09750 [Candidatus Cloacimonadota bacterium]|nr:MAG: hypothetical protein COB02_09750 [Candidatus Cloacimonadota bacterium]